MLWLRPLRPCSRSRSSHRRSAAVTSDRARLEWLIEPIVRSAFGEQAMPTQSLEQRRAWLAGKGAEHALRAEHRVAVHPTHLTPSLAAAGGSRRSIASEPAGEAANVPEGARARRSARGWRGSRGERRVAAARKAAGSERALKHLLGGCFRNTFGTYFCHGCNRKSPILRIWRGFLMPEEGLEPPTRGL